MALPINNRRPERANGAAAKINVSAEKPNRSGKQNARGGVKLCRRRSATSGFGRRAI